MSCLIAILGGLLVMMGQHSRSESLFYYFRLEDHVPENHLLRLIDRHISFEFVREKLRDSYSGTGRPSIDPEVLLRILLIGYLYGVTSERKLVEELRMHLAWRWFTGLGFDQEIPHHSMFSKNRHGRFQEANRYLCPAGKPLTYVGVNALNRTHVYAATPKRCRDCPQKTQCTKGRCRFLGVHIHEPARQRAQELARTPLSKVCGVQKGVAALRMSGCRCSDVATADSIVARPKLSKALPACIVLRSI